MIALIDSLFKYAIFMLALQLVMASDKLAAIRQPVVSVDFNIQLADGENTLSPQTQNGQNSVESVVYNLSCFSTAHNSY